MPSPIRLIRRWTRKNPTAGASTPTTAPVASARRMNSRSSSDMACVAMRVRRVVPPLREIDRCPVEHDRAPDDDQPLDVGLDRPELMGDVEDRHPQLTPEPVEQGGQDLLCLGVDAARRLVE